MTTALAPRTGLPGELRDQAYVLPPDLTLDEWGNVLRLADRLAGSSSWWLADAMLYGEDRWGEACSQALPGPDEDPYGISQARIKQAAWLGRVFPPNTRVPEASFTHHRIVAELPPQDRLTLLAEVAKAAQDVADGVEGATLISTRELGRRAKARQERLAGTSVTIDGEVLDAAELPWVATLDDLTERARADVESHAPLGRQRSAWLAGVLWALVYGEQRDLFREGAWRL